MRAFNRVGPSDYSDLSRTARADTEPGRVQNIRLQAQGDGSVTIAWDKPPTTSRILDYTITWVGGQGTVPGNQTTFRAEGLNNNEKYVFTIKAQNKVDYSAPRSSAEFQPLGTPPAPPAPTVTDLEAGPNQTSLRVAWQGVLPEGAGPTVYTVSYSNSVTSGPVPGCQKLASLTCTHAGVPYDGMTYTYTVVAANQPPGRAGNRSAPSAGTSIEAVGRPAAWGSFEVVPTGNSQEAEVRYTVPDSRGTTSKVDILVAGLANRSFNQQVGANATRISTPSNQEPYAVQLRVCNEGAPAGCTLSALQNVQTYGRLDGMLNDIGDPTVNGKSITWTITGSSNGNAAQLAVRVNNGSTQLIDINTVGGFSQPFTTTTTNFDEIVTLEVTLQDPAPAGRGSATKRRTGDQSGPPPAPAVRVAKDACSDADGSTNACQQNGSQPECVEASCGRVKLVISGLYAGDTIRCAVDNSDNSSWWDNNRSWGPYLSDSDQVLPIYYRSGTTTAQCTWRRFNGTEVVYQADPATW